MLSQSAADPAPNATVLMVDDDARNLMALEAILDGAGYRLVSARSGEEALRLLRNEDFAVVLLDVLMDGMDGFETAKLIRSQSRCKTTPIIFLTAHDADRKTIEEAYMLGAVDFLVKPFSPVVLRAKVAGFVDLYQKTKQVEQQGDILRQQEKKAHRRALSEQREWFRVALSSIGDAVIATDKSANITYMNAVAETLTEYQTEEVVGTPISSVFKIIHEETRKPAFNPIEKVLAEGVTVGLANHTALISRTGREYVIEDSAAPIKNDEGEVVGVILVFHDSTDKHRAAERLRHSEEQHRLIVETANEGIWKLDKDAKIIYVNPRLCEMLGHTTKEMLGKYKWDFLFPEDESWCKDIWERRKSGISEQVDIRFRHKSGRQIWTLMAARAIMNERGEFCGALDMFSNITPRKQAENERKMVQDTLAHIIYRAPVGIIIVDEDLRITLVNQPLAELTTMTPEQLVGMTIMEAYGNPRCVELAEQVFRTNQPILGVEVESETQNGHRHKRFWLENWFPVPPDQRGKRRIAVIAQENTEQRRLRSELEQKVIDLADANARKDEFLAILGHELRNPLAAVTNAIKLVRRGNDTQKTAGLDILSNQCEHINKLVDDIIHVSRAVRGRIEIKEEVVSVTEVIERALEIAEPTISRFRHKVSVEHPCNGGITVLGDKIRLIQVLSNLLTNAAKYTNEGGLIEVSCEKEGACAKIAVKDNGIGIEPTDIDHIFDLCVRTERAKHKENGLGVGLTMAKAVVELHGGTITAFSEGHDRGSEFVVRIPIREEKTHAGSVG